MAYENELDVAREAAKNAGLVALQYQQQGVLPESKSDDSPVTIADRESERLISQALLLAFPDDGQLGEEGASGEGKSRRRWIIDPIDGTREFVRNSPLWCILIGLEDQGEVVAGVAHFPALQETYWASKGGGAYWNGKQIHVSSRSRPDESVLLVNGLSLMRGTAMGDFLMPRLADWIQGFWATRSLGGSFDACLVASGRAEVWIEPKVAAWDLAAHKIILEEAGARFFNSKGKSDIYSGNAIACVPGIEAEIRKFFELS